MSGTLAELPGQVDQVLIDKKLLSRPHLILT